MQSRRLLVLMVAAVVAAIAGCFWIRGVGTTPRPAGSAPSDAGAPPPPAPPPVALKGRRAGPTPAPEAGAAPAGDAAAVTTVVVSVFDEADAPFAKASVTLSAHGGGARLGPIETGTDGVATFPSVPVGDFWVGGRAPSFEMGQGNGVARAGEASKVRIVMRALVPVTGHVRLPSGDGTSALVRVVRGGTFGGRTETCSGSWCEVAKTMSAPDGAFRVEVPRDLIVTVVASAAGYARAEAVLQRSREGEEVTLTLEPGGTLRGIVRSPDGTPCAGARVYVVPADEPAFLENPRYVIGVDGSKSWSSGDDSGDEGGSMGGSMGGHSGPAAATKKAIRVVSGQDGAFEVDGLRLPAAYRALAEGCSGARGVSADAALSAAARTASADVALTARSVLWARFETPDGAAATEGVGATLAGAREHFLDPRGGHRDALGFEKGRAKFEGLLAGTYELQAYVGGSVPLVRTVEVPAGQTIEVVVRGVAGRTLAGTVRDGAGRPIAGSTVNWYTKASAGVLNHSLRVTSDEQGKFELRGLQDAPGTLSAEAEGFVYSEPREFRPGAEAIVVVLRAGAELRGRLSVPSGASLPSDAWIAEFADRRLGGMRNAKVAPDGTFRHSVVRLGEPTAFVLLPRVGAWVVLGTFSLASEESRDLGAIPIDEGRAVSGRVTDSKGKPLPGVVVWGDVREAPGLGDGMMVERQQDTTDAAGRFRLRRMPKSAVVLRTDLAPYAPAAVLHTGESEASVVLVPGAVVSGRLLDAAGAPAANRSLELTGGSPDALPPRGMTDANGAFSIDALPAGTYVGIVYLVGTMSSLQVGGVTLAEGEQKTLEWRIP